MEEKDVRDADESQTAPTFASASAVDVDNIPTIFTNNSFIDVNASDVTIVFAHDHGVGDRRVTKPTVRMVFSHAGFMEFINFALKRANYLTTVYGGEVPSLNTIYNKDPEMVIREFNRMYGIAEQDEDGEEGESL
jgi:hypothetical protein